jgi:hypothetical protein
MAHWSVQSPIARIHHHVHHIPALELNIARRPGFAVIVAGKEDCCIILHKN